MRGLLFAIIFLLAATTAYAADCRVEPQARTFGEFLAEVPSLDEQLQSCPLQLADMYGVIPKTATIVLDVDGEQITATVENAQLTSISLGGAACTRKVVMSREDADLLLGSPDRTAALTYLFANKRIQIKGCNTLSRIGLWFTQPIGRYVLGKTLPAPQQQQVPEPQEGALLCDFYNAPTKQIVTCGAHNAADTFCANAMGSRDARAIACDDDGQVLCSVPCGVHSAVKQMNRCAFDINRARGTQAPPVGSCPAPTAPEPGKKEPGEVCQHGGECRTGNCVGTGQGPPWTYKCSCDPFRYEQTGC